MEKKIMGNKKREKLFMAMKHHYQIGTKGFYRYLYRGGYYYKNGTLLITMRPKDSRKGYIIKTFKSELPSKSRAEEMILREFEREFGSTYERYVENNRRNKRKGARKSFFA